MRKLLSVTLLALALAGCGGGGGGSSGSFGASSAGGSTSSATAANLLLTASTSTIPADGSASADITAVATDSSNRAVSGVAVTFSANSGVLSAPTPTTTDSNGQIKVTLSTPGNATPRTITVTATAGTLTKTVNVQVVAAPAPTTVQMGSGTGAGFQAGILGLSTASLSAGGSTSVQVVLQQSDGSLYTQPATITFSSACQAQGRATITSPVTTNSGVASTTYAATGCTGSDVITATATLGGRSLSATGTVTVAAASIGSIVFESATPTNVSLKGTASSGRVETSTVVFRVLDQSGGPRSGATVNFTLNTSVGGVTVSPATAQSDANGRVQTVVQAGNVATTVRVTATVMSTTPAIATQSTQLTITTGIPVQNAMSVAVTCPNVEAWNIDGVNVTVSARLADRFGNPVPDGTAVTFNTEGGKIGGQCVTATNASTGESGVCAVTWTSQNPRPAGGLGQSGRSTVMGTAIGEENFTDVNGNGAFDNGEPFEDRAERFRDDNENGVYDPGEYFYDFDNNGVRDAPDGYFNGVLCNDTNGRCAGPKSTGIAASTLIIMSASTPARVSPAPPTSFTVTKGGNLAVAFRFADLNDNPMPSGTTISATATGDGLSVPAPSSFSVPCTTGPTTYSFVVAASATATASGILNISVKTPGGVETVLQYPIATQ
jgi:hypothetical protein